VIVAFGEALVDLYAQPEGATVATAGSFVPFPGGAPANVATTLARLGVPVRFVGAVGNDAHGTRLLAHLAAAGVDLAVPRVPSRTGITFVERLGEGRRSFLFYRNGGADLGLSEAHLRALPTAPWEGMTTLVLGTSALVTDALRGAALRMLTEARARGARLVVDLNVRAHLWADRPRLEHALATLCAQAWCLKASGEDLEALALEPSLQSLQRLNPNAYTVLTRGALGAEIGGWDTTLQFPTEPVSELDPVGAGDAFLAGLLAVLEAGGEALRSSPEGWRAAVAFGQRLGALAVGALGPVEGLGSVGPGALREALAGWGRMVSNDGDGKS
jgi:fructokinase